jgi:hypothetical protein
MSTTNGTQRWSFVTQICRDRIISLYRHDHDKRDPTVVICDTDMPWRNYVYDKRNLMVVICDTDMPWQNYVYDKRNLTW